MAAPRNAFPVSVEDFDADERISWSKVDNKFILEEANGNEWEFDEQLKRWVPTVDKDLLEQQGKAYQVAGVDESEDVQEQLKAKKRKKNGDDDEGQNPAKRQNGVSSAVYATSIPLDATLADIDEVFKKYGMIAESMETEEKRIKMYTDEQGNFKGEALIVYFRPESVAMAIEMLDDTAFNFKQGPNGNMRVQIADASFKRQKETDGGSTKAKPAKKSMADRKKLEAGYKRMHNKLTDWGDEDGYQPANADSAGSRWERIVVLKHMFTLQELEEDPNAEDEIQADVMEEAQKHGEVEKVFVFNQEADGVVVVKFSDPDSAKSCVQTFDGRMFDKRAVVAYIADGQELFKRIKKNNDAEDEARLEQFGKDLQSGALVKDVDGEGEKNNGD